jgi:hypothetical protein
MSEPLSIDPSCSPSFHDNNNGHNVSPSVGEYAHNLSKISLTKKGDFEHIKMIDPTAAAP